MTYRKAILTPPLTHTNKPGQPIYWRQDGSAIEVKTEASILPVNKRPRLGVRILSSN